MTLSGMVSLLRFLKRRFFWYQTHAATINQTVEVHSTGQPPPTTEAGLSS
jgi:hypothetical protein